MTKEQTKNLIGLSLAGIGLTAACHITPKDYAGSDTRYFDGSVETEAIETEISRRNVKLPVVRNGIQVGTIDTVIDQDGKNITNDSRINVSLEGANLKDPSDEFWVPFKGEDGLLQGHYVGNAQDLKTTLKSNSGIYADENHTLSIDRNTGAYNPWALAGAGAGLLAAGYGLSELMRKRKNKK